MGFAIWNLGFAIWNLEFGIWNLEFGIWNLGFGIWDLGFGIWDLGFGIWDLGFGIWDLNFGIYFPSVALRFFTEVKESTKHQTMNINPWHGVPIGTQQPEIVQAIVEISKNSRAKYELDKETGMLMLDRVLYSSVFYPANYGFIPQTLGADNDPLDILVLSQIEIQPLCIVRAKVIGVMRMIDNNEADDKIIAVAADDVSVSHIKDISGLPPYFHSELKHFFEEYKKLENKTVLVEDFQDTDTAKQIIQTAIEDYKKKFG